MGYDSGFYGLFKGLFGALAIIAIIGIAVYVLFSIELYRCVKKTGQENPWLVWLPFGREYTLAKVLDPDADGKVRVIGDLKISASVFCFWWVLEIVLGYIPTIGGILTWVLIGLCMGASYRALYAKLDGLSEEQTNGIGIASGFIPIIPLFKLWTYAYGAKKNEEAAYKREQSYTETSDTTYRRDEESEGFDHLS